MRTHETINTRCACAPRVNYLQLCLRNPSDACSIIHNAKTDILAKDWEHTIRQTNSHPSLAVVAATDNISSSWNTMWDEALEYGIRGTKLMQHLFGTLSKPVFGDRICSYCKDSITVLQSYPQHLVSQHLTEFDLNSIKNWLENKDFKNLFRLAEALSSLQFHSM